MKLYIYEHCPFCVRARMIFGLRDVPLTLDYFLNDDEATPIALIGAKQVPILQKPDGSHMGESLDIVRFVDEYANTGERINETIRPEIQAWFDDFAAFGNRLIMPRDVQLNLPEFATQSAIDYFITKKEANIGNFADNLANSEQYIAQANAQLTKLSQMLPETPIYLNNNDLSMEDIIIFPLLRNLSMVRGVHYPANVLAYTQNMARQSNINLYFDVAI